MAAVSSVLFESTTTISSAQATDASAPSMSAASFLVMMVTESFGNRRECNRARKADAGRAGVGAWLGLIEIAKRLGAWGQPKRDLTSASPPQAPTRYCRMIAEFPVWIAPEPAVTMPPPPPFNGTACTASKSTSDLL